MTGMTQTPAPYVLDRDGLVWRVVRDGGMATRADYTGITSIGINALEQDHGPLRYFHPEALLAEVARLREAITDDPYCGSCGRVNLTAPRDVRQRLREAGVPSCSLSSCPRYRTTAVYDHEAHRWVPVAGGGAR